MSGQRVRQSWLHGLRWHGLVRQDGIRWSGAALGLYGSAGQALDLRRPLGAEGYSGPGLHSRGRDFEAVCPKKLKIVYLASMDPQTGERPTWKRATFPSQGHVGLEVRSGYVCAWG